MAKQWRMIRVPVALAERLDAQCEKALDAHSKGKIILPSEMAEKVPIYYAIQRALDELDAKRERSRKPRPAVDRAMKREARS